MIKYIMKTVGLLYMLTTGLSQDMVGGVKDSGGCYISSGYQWCNSLQKCVRPWITQCGYVKHETTFCPDSNMQLCRMRCHVPQCQENQCAMRTGSCCDIKCVPQPGNLPDPPPPPSHHNSYLKLGDVCKSGGVETGEGVHRMNDCPPGSKCSPSNQMSIGGESPWKCKKLSKENQLIHCKTWYDGCNRCFVKNGKIGGCSMMYCIRKKEPKCLVYNTNH